MGIALFGGIAFFVVVLIAHIFLWRLLKPESEITALVIMFIFVPIVLFMGIFFVLGSRINWQTIDFIASLILYYSLSFAYIQTYPVINCEIPSFKILRIINKSMPAGASYEDIERNFDSEELLKSRTDLLVMDGLIINTQMNGMKLSLKGKILANIFLVLRKIYGLDIGEG